MRRAHVLTISCFCLEQELSCGSADLEGNAPPHISAFMAGGVSPCFMVLVRADDGERSKRGSEVLLLEKASRQNHGVPFSPSYETMNVHEFPAGNTIGSFSGASIPMTGSTSLKARRRGIWNRSGTRGALDARRTLSRICCLDMGGLLCSIAVHIHQSIESILQEVEVPLVSHSICYHVLNHHITLQSPCSFKLLIGNQARCRAAAGADKSPRSAQQRL
jgi:hypothetical protein